MSHALSREVSPMSYLLNRKGNYYYNRRVPEPFQDLDDRVMVRVALGTKCRRTAWRKAVVLNDQVEAYWQELAKNNRPHDNRNFRRTVRIARQMGFGYLPMATLLTRPVSEVVDRVLALQGATLEQAEAALGAKDEPVLPLNSVLDKYWDLSRDMIMNKTPDQVRKWRNPRIRVMKAFIQQVGNKDLKAIGRDDIVAYRDWWLDRIEKGGSAVATANRDIFTLKGILELVSDHSGAGLDTARLFKKIKLNNRFKKKRRSFTTEQIRALLHSPKLNNLNSEAKWFLYAMADTGARSSEILGLLPEDIRLNVPIPHIGITDRKERSLKTEHSERIIPLVGYALEAFKACPNGFPRYRDKPDNLSNALNKFLRENDLLPTEQHSVYSMRHSFQDRMLVAKVPDILQANLMGHKYRERPQYGEGGELKEKLEWMEKVCVKRLDCILPALV